MQCLRNYRSNDIAKRFKFLGNPIMKLSKLLNSREGKNRRSEYPNRSESRNCIRHFMDGLN